MSKGMKFLGSPSSGSLQGTTYSHNRFGQYTRSRSSPVQPNSPAQGLVRARLSGNAALWRTLTALQRSGWASLGAEITRTDALGQTYTLDGFEAFCSVNNNRLFYGSAVVLDAPAYVTPAALTTATVTLTAAAFSIAFTPTPAPALTKVVLFAGPQRSAGRAYEGDYRYIMMGAAATASPLVATTAYATKFGTPVVGNKVFLSLVTLTEGFESGPLHTAAVVST